MPTAMTVVTQPASNFTLRLKVPGFTVQFLQFFFGASNLCFQNLQIFFNFLSLEVQRTFFSAAACCCCGTRRFWCERQMLRLQRLVVVPNSVFPGRFVSFYWVAVNLSHLLVEIFFIIPFFYFFSTPQHFFKRKAT